MIWPISLQLKIFDTDEGLIELLTEEGFSINTNNPNYILVEVKPTRTETGILFHQLPKYLSNTPFKLQLIARETCQRFKKQDQVTIICGGKGEALKAYHTRDNTNTNALFSVDYAFVIFGYKDSNKHKHRLSIKNYSVHATGVLSVEVRYQLIWSGFASSFPTKSEKLDKFRQAIQAIVGKLNSEFPYRPFYYQKR